MLDSNAYTLTTGSFSVYFHFSESRIFLPPSHKWHPKRIKLICQITKFTLSDRIYPTECTYIKIEDILWPRQILRAVKVRAIWWGKGPYSLLVSKSIRFEIFRTLRSTRTLDTKSDKFRQQLSNRTFDTNQHSTVWIRKCWRRFDSSRAIRSYPKFQSNLDYLKFQSNFDTKSSIKSFGQISKPKVSIKISAKRWQWNLM